jgi:CBS domain-containing protein
MLVCVIADFIALYYLPNSIMTEKLARRGLNTHSEFETNVMRQVQVSEVMSTEVSTIPATMTVGEATDRIAAHDPALAAHHGLAILDKSGQLAGIVTQSDLLRTLAQDGGRTRPVIETGSRSVIVCYPDERVFDALTKMLRNDIGRLLVVSRGDTHKVVGYISRSNVMSAWNRHLDDESLREHGWLNRWLERAARSQTPQT